MLSAASRLFQIVCLLSNQYSFLFRPIYFYSSKLKYTIDHHYFSRLFLFLFIYQRISPCCHIINILTVMAINRVINEETLDVFDVGLVYTVQCI